jgi:hypothetical protein
LGSASEAYCPARLWSGRGFFIWRADAVTEARSGIDARARRRWRRVSVADLKESLPARPSSLGLAVA